MASIILSAESLRKKFDTQGDEKAVRLIQIALRSARNLVTYVDNMLDYSKAPSTLLERQETLDFRFLLENLIPMLNVPQDFQIIMPERMNIRTSKIAMEQIMLNLLSNAIRYNDKDKPQIEVSCCLENDQYVLSVADNGRGISAEDIKNIFREGFTAQENDRFNRKGNGFGLDAVSSLVGKMQGSIKVDSILKQGTTISISLPA
ncbi:MAG: sensor histidine kinase [Pedobacter sp.]|nr:MAG: sensor histidine kinase [Pedobacter sp.]